MRGSAPHLCCKVTPPPIPAPSILSSRHSNPKQGKAAQEKQRALVGTQHCWARRGVTREGADNRFPHDPGLEGLQLSPHAARHRVVAASLPAPAATSQTKWRAAAARRDGRATTPLAMPRGGGGSAASLSPQCHRGHRHGAALGAGTERCLPVGWSGRCSAGSLSPPSPDAVAWDLSRQESGSHGVCRIQGRGHCPVR